MKRVLVRESAQADLVAAASHYRTADGDPLAQRMVDTALDELDTISRQAGSGSPRLAHLCDVPGLRSWRVTGFPMQWLYFERDDAVDIVRLVGDRQDLLAILRATE